MARVKKRSGELQDFDRKRLVESMKRAGAEEPVASRIANMVQPTEGVTTLDLRGFVVNELRKTNQALADEFGQTLRLAARGRDDLDKGVARVPKRIERVPDVKAGQPARVGAGDTRVAVRVEPALETREVWLNRRDLDTLGAPEGTRIPVRFLREGEGGTQLPGATQSRPVGSPTPRGG